MKRFRVDAILDFEIDSGGVSVCIDHGPGEPSGGVHSIKWNKIPELVVFLQEAIRLNQQQPMPAPEPIDGMLRSVAAIEHVTGGITPIAIEKFENGKWTRLGYDGGSRIISLDEWKAGPQP
jgi:hypothetical protein